MDRYQSITIETYLYEEESIIIVSLGVGTLEVPPGLQFSLALVKYNHPPPLPGTPPLPVDPYKYPL